ncbi:MAG: translocation/assembly module TamB domain-containing protein [Terriglobales bacterium]
MSEQPVPPVRRRILRNLFLLFCGFTLVALGLLSWYVTTDSFQARMRQRVIAELEKATGGRVDLGELHTIPFRLRVDARNLTIHGREAADQKPLLQVERLEAELKIIWLLGASVGLHSLVLEHPVVHIIDYPDGTTNIPIPPVKYSSGQGPMEDLISLSVARIQVEKGELLWEDRKLPFEFQSRDVALRLHYSLLRQRYEAQVAVGGVTTRWQQYHEFEWGADAALVLARGHAEINSLDVRSGNSRLHFAGELKDFHDPQITGEYHGLADIAEWAGLLRQKEFRKGTVEFAGKGSWNLRDFSIQGTLQAKDVDWSNSKLVMRNGRVETGFSVTPEHLQISSMKATLLGGNLLGEMAVTNWQNSMEPSTARARRGPIGRIAPESMQRGRVHVQLAGFPLNPVLEILSTKKLPLDRLNFAGSASGLVDLLWVGSIQDAETKLKLDVSPPIHPAAEGIPVSGKIDATYRGSRDELEVSALKLTTRASEIEASGSLAATSGLRFSLTSHNLKEWTPLLEVAYGSSTLPFAVHGWAQLSGNASGRLSALSLSGNLEAYDFETTVSLLPRARAQSIHWDALTTAVQYSSSNFAAHNGSLIHGRTVAHFDVSSALADGAFTENSPFSVHVDALNGDVAEIARLMGIDHSLAGKIGVTANISGTANSPHGSGRFEVRDGTAYGIAVPFLNGDLRLANGEVELSGLEGRAYDAPISGSGSISTSNYNFRLNLAGRNIDLAHFSRLQSSRFSVDGMGDFTGQMSGTWEQPSLEAHVHVKGIALDKERVGDFYADAVTVGRRLDVKAHSAFDKSDLTVQGSVDLQKEFTADLKLDFHDLDVVSLLGIYLPGNLTGHSPMEGTVQLRGPLRTPRDLKVAAEIRSFRAEIDRVQVQNVDPIRFEVLDQSVMIENFHVAGSGTDFTAHGRAHLTGAQEIDLGLDGSVNMTLLQLLNPKILARGTLGVNLTAAGSLRDPVLQGHLDVKDTFISHNDFPSGLSDLNGVLLFDRNHIQIEKLTGTTGGGAITVTGTASYQSGIATLDLGATAQGVRLRYPPGVSSTANANLRLTGTSNSAALSGDVVITKLAVTPGFDFGAYIERSRQAAVLTQGDSLANRLRLDVHVATTPELQMQTAIARLSGDADLRVRGTADRPVILGRAEVLEGEISFNGTKYRLERGDVTFANPAKTQPIIDLQASTRVRDYDITVRFRGDASQPNGLKVTWQSEPQLPEADVIALLALGRTREESAAAQSGGSLGFGGEASNLLINEALNSTVNSRLQRLFGVSRIKIDPQGLASETAVVRGPQVTVEQQVASNVTLTYSTNVSVSNQQIIQLEYNITRNVSIVALRDQNGIVSFDFRIRRRKK